jgi:hypothetical protein
MEMKSLFAWIGRGIGNARGLFPFSHEGRQTLVYICLAWAAPIICGMVLWAMRAIRDWGDAPAVDRLNRFADIADRLSWGLVLILVAYACFVSIRAVKIGKDGFSAESRDDAAAGAQLATDAAQAVTEELKP